MHNLEHTLFCMSHVLKDKQPKLAADLLQLASASHEYLPTPHTAPNAPWRDADESLTDLNVRWRRRFNRLRPT